MTNTQQLLSQALIDICKTKSLDNITITELTQKCNLTRQIFYYHFEDKYALAKWVHLNDLANAFRSDADTSNVSIDSQYYCLQYLTVLKSRKIFYQNLYHSVETKEFQRIMRDFFYNSYLDHIKCTRSQKISENLLWVIRAYCFGSSQLIFDWIQSGMRMPTKQLCDIVFLSMPACLQELLLDFDLHYYCS